MDETRRDRSSSSKRNVKMAVVYVCHTLDRFGVGDTGLTPETIRRAKMSGAYDAVRRCSGILYERRVHPLLRTIHDLLLVELAGWPRPRVIRKSLKLIWKGREQAEKEASAEDDDLHSAKKFPREALVFVKCQLAILRCPVTSLQASRDRKSSSYSSSRTLLFVFAWLLVKLDFFRKSSTLWAESSSSSSASSCAFSKSIVESPSGCDTTTTTDFHRIARCKDPLYNNEAHNAAAVGIREAQRVVSKLWACPQDKQGAQGINDQVNRTATLNGKLWKCVSSIASLQSCRYRMLHDMSDTIKDITRERMNDLKNRHKHGYESDVKTIPHDDPSLDAYQLHLIRDPIQMDHHLAAVDRVTMLVRAEVTALCHSSSFYLWLSNAVRDESNDIAEYDRDDDDDDDDDVEGDDSETSYAESLSQSHKMTSSRHNTIWRNRSVTQVVEVGLNLCSTIEKHLLAIKPILAEIMEGLKLDDETSNKNVLSDTVCQHSQILSAISIHKLQLHASQESGIEPYIVDPPRIPKDVDEMFCRARRGKVSMWQSHTMNTYKNSITNSEIRLLEEEEEEEGTNLRGRETNNNNDDGVSDTLDTQDLDCLVAINKELLTSLGILRAEHRKHIEGAVECLIQDDDKFHVSM